MHLSTLHAILMYRSSFGTSNRGCAAPQRVAGPYDNLQGLVRDHSTLGSAGVGLCAASVI